MGKSDKKKEKKRHKSKKREKKSDSKESSIIGSLLAIGLISHPQLNDEVSVLISSLDAGKQIVIHRETTDPAQLFLIKLLNCLPVECRDNRIWSKQLACPSVAKFILSDLLGSMYIKQPRELSEPERSSSRAVYDIIPLLQKFPTLSADLIELLRNLSIGEAVDIGGLESDEIKDSLSAFFRSLGIDSEDDSVYIVPKVSEPAEALRIVISAIEKGITPLQHNDKARDRESTTGRVKSSSSSSSSGSEDANDEMGPGKQQPVPRRVMQPAAPTPQEMRLAQEVLQSVRTFIHA